MQGKQQQHNLSGMVYFPAYNISWPRNNVSHLSLRAWRAGLAEHGPARWGGLVVLHFWGFGGERAGGKVILNFDWNGRHSAATEVRAALIELRGKQKRWTKESWKKKVLNWKAKEGLNKDSIFFLEGSSLNAFVVIGHGLWLKWFWWNLELTHANDNP